MSTTVDERVVSMQFDNRNFEKNVSTSISTLDKLKNSLKFDGIANSFSKITNASRKVSFEPLSNGVEVIKGKFTALEAVAIGAFTRIGQQAVMSIEKIVKSLTGLEQVQAGFREYETQINSVQTILANTKHQGTDIHQVNKALDELNAYADKTIYNFTEMTRNIGTFTAAGVELQTSVDSIKGIANLAAVSGSTSHQASTAMYQLSQALAAGRVSLMDWNSVVNAGMGGKVFQDALLRTSEVLKTGGKEAVNTYGSFRNSLTQGQWLTTEVLTETLKQFSGAYSEADLIAQGFTKEQAADIAEMAKTADEAATKVKTFTQLTDVTKEAIQSGWSQTFRLIFGDFEEVKALFTPISNYITGIVGAMSDARNEMLSEWKELGGRTALIESLATAYKHVESTIVAVKDAFREVFPAMSGDQLYGLTLKFQDLVEKVKLSDTQIKRLASTAKSFFLVLSSIGKTVKMVLAYTKPIISPVLTFVGSLLRKFSEIQTCIQAFVETFGTVIRHYMTLESFVKDSFIINALARVLTLLVSIANRANVFNIAQKYAGEFAAAGAKVATMLANLDRYLWQIAQEFKVLITPFAEVFDAVRAKFLEVYYLVRVFVLAFNEALGIGKEVSDTAKKSTIGTILKTVAGWLSTIAQRLNSVNLLREGLVLFYSAGVKAAEALLKIRETLSNIDVNAVLGKFKSLKDTVFAFFDGLSKKFKMTDLFSDLGEFIKTAKTNFITPGLDKVANVFDVIREKVFSVTKIFSGFKTALGFASGIVAGLYNILKDLASGVGKFFNSALGTVGSSISDVFGKLLSGDISSFIKIINSLLSSGILYELLSIFVKFKSGLNGLGDGLKDLKDGGFNLGKILFGNNPDKVTNSFAGVCDSISKALGGLTKNLDANALVTAAKSIAVLAGSLFVLSLVEPSKLVMATTAIGVLFLEISKSLTILSALNLAGGKKLISLTSLITSMAVSVGILSVAIRLLTSAKPEAMAAATSAVMTVLAGFTYIIKMMSDSNVLTVSKGMKSIGGQLIAFAASIWIISSAVKKLANLDAENMWVGLSAIMILMGTFTALMSKADMSSNITKAAVGILAFAVAINALALAIVPLAIIYKIDPMALLAGLGSIITLMAAFAGISKWINGFDITKASIGIMAFAMAIDALALAIIPLAVIYKIDPMALLAGLGSLIAMMGSFAIISKTIKGSEITKAAIGILAFAVAIDAITLALIPLSTISSISPLAFTLAIAGLIALMAALTGISKMAGGLSLMTFGAGLIVVSAGLISLGTGMTALSVGLSSLGSIKWTAILTGLIALVGTFAVVGVASAALAAASPIILVLSVSIMALGAGLLFLASAGVLFAGSLTTILSGLSGFLIGISGVIITALPSLMTALVEFLGSTVLVLCQAITKYAVPIAQAVLQAILSIIVVLNETLPAIIDALIVLMSDVLGKKVGPFVDALFGMFVSILEGFNDALVKYGDRVAQSVHDIIINLVYIIADTLTLFWDDFIGFGEYLIDGFIEGIKSVVTNVKDTVVNLGKDILSWFGDVLGINSPSKEFKKDGKFSAIGYQDGINEERSSTKETVEEYAELITDTMDENVNADTGANTMANWTSGMNQALKESAPGLASTVDTLGSGLGDGFMNSLFGSMGTTANAIQKKLTRKTTGGKHAQEDFIRQQIIAAAGNTINPNDLDRLVQEQLDRLDAQEEAQNTGNDILSNILGQFSGVTSGLKKGTTFNWADNVGSTMSDSGSKVDTDAIEKSLANIGSGGNGNNTIISDLSSNNKGNSNNLLVNTNKVPDISSNTSSLASSTDETAKQMNSHMQTLSKQLSNLQSAISNLAETEKRGNWYNTFSIEKASNPKEVATEVAEILQKQVERSYAKWA